MQLERRPRRPPLQVRREEDAFNYYNYYTPGLRPTTRSTTSIYSINDCVDSSPRLGASCSQWGMRHGKTPARRGASSSSMGQTLSSDDGFPNGLSFVSLQGGNKFGNHMKNKEERGYGILWALLVNARVESTSDDSSSVRRPQGGSTTRARLRPGAVVSQAGEQRSQQIPVDKPQLGKCASRQISCASTTRRRTVRRPCGTTRRLSTASMMPALALFTYSLQICCERKGLCPGSFVRSMQTLTRSVVRRAAAACGWAPRVWSASDPRWMISFRPEVKYIRLGASMMWDCKIYEPCALGCFRLGQLRRVIAPLASPRRRASRTGQRHRGSVLGGHTSRTHRMLGEHTSRTHRPARPPLCSWAVACCRHSKSPKRSPPCLCSHALRSQPSPSPRSTAPRTRHVLSWLHLRVGWLLAAFAPSCCPLPSGRAARRSPLCSTTQAES